jgi:putative transposase
MVNLWFTEKDVRYRWAEVKDSFWEELESWSKQSAKLVLQAALQAELRQAVQAGRYERTNQRRDYRNGSYSREVVCKLGVLSDVSVPRSRRGAYHSEVLDRYRRFGGNFDRYVLRLFTLGLSTRRVEEFFVSLFGPCGLGAQTVSTIVGRVQGELARYRSRRLSDQVRYLYLDGIRVVIRSAFRQPYVVLCALAEYTDGRRELVSFRVARSEKTVHWQAFLDDLYRRGLVGRHLELIVADGAAGLLEAAQTVYGQVPVQVCWVHKQRNLVSRLRCQRHRQAIGADVAAIFHAPSKAAAVALLRRFEATWRNREATAVRVFLAAIDQSLTFYQQPPQDWEAIASTNLIERQLRELRRRIRLIDSFRNERSCETILYTQITRLNEKLNTIRK